jgi:hypothetical protein
MAAGLVLTSASTASAYTITDPDGVDCGIQFWGNMAMEAYHKGYKNHRWYIDSGVTLFEHAYSSYYRREESRIWNLDHSHKNTAYGSLGVYGLDVWCA